VYWGEGSTFYFTLPLATGEVIAMKVLLVEDDPGRGRFAGGNTLKAKPLRNGSGHRWGIGL
jgi:hypothetical protein